MNRLTTIAAIGLSLACLGRLAPHAVAQQEAGVSDEDASPILAVVDGHPITQQAITPPREALDANRRARAASGDYELWLRGTRAANFRAQVLDRIRPLLLQRHNLRATEPMIQDALRLLDHIDQQAITQLEDRLDELHAIRAEAVRKGEPIPDRIAREERQISDQLDQLHRIVNRPDTSQSKQELYYQIDKNRRVRATAIVEAWLMRQALHEEYGGKVVLTNSTYEPAEAYALWFDTLQREGTLRFMTPAAEESFRFAFRFDGQPRIDAPDDAYDTPPWTPFLEEAARKNAAGEPDDAIPQSDSDDPGD